MDAFYASVELLRYPELKGQPVVIGGGRRHQPTLRPDGSREFSVLRDYTGRGVVTTSTYEARAFGVHSGMGVMKSAQLAPAAILLPVDFDEYRKYSRLFKSAVRSIAPCVEDRGIDEIYVDLTDVPGAQDDGGRAVARRLKDAVHAATGLTCSIGVTPNKLLSKICSDLDKPDGLTLLEPADIPARIWPLPAKKVNGIGPKASEKLAKLGIHTIGDVAAADPALLLQHFGKSFGTWLHEASHGRDEREVVTFSEPRSISRETTFDRDLHAVRDRAELGRIFTELVRTAGRRPRPQGLRRQDDRDQAALRRLQVGDARPDLAGAYAGRARHSPGRRRLPEAGRSDAAPAAARRARRQPGDPGRTGGAAAGRARKSSPPRPSPRSTRTAAPACRSSTRRADR